MEDGRGIMENELGAWSWELGVWNGLTDQSAFS
jgi:hypothetical protein